MALNKVNQFTDIFFPMEYSFLSDKTVPNCCTIDSLTQKPAHINGSLNCYNRLYCGEIETFPQLLFLQINQICERFCGFVPIFRIIPLTQKTKRSEQKATKCFYVAISIRLALVFETKQYFLCAFSRSLSLFLYFLFSIAFSVYITLSIPLQVPSNKFCMHIKYKFKIDVDFCCLRINAIFLAWNCVRLPHHSFGLVISYLLGQFFDSIVANHMDFHFLFSFSFEKKNNNNTHKYTGTAIVWRNSMGW